VKSYPTSEEYQKKILIIKRKVFLTFNETAFGYIFGEEGKKCAQGQMIASNRKHSI
jgi:hypothetical protein